MKLKNYAAFGEMPCFAKAMPGKPALPVRTFSSLTLCIWGLYNRGTRGMRCMWGGELLHSFNNFKFSFVTQGKDS
jgi:hypothetical protein